MKRFALLDTLPDPYFTIDAGATAALTVNVGPCESKGESRFAVEIWRGQTILCRLFGKSVQVAEASTTANPCPRGK